MIIKNRDGKLILFYGEPNPKILHFMLEYSFELKENLKTIIIIDVNNIVTPKDIASFEKILDKETTIYKPSSINNMLNFLEEILYLERNYKIADLILLLDLYIYIDRNYFPKLKYDPIYVFALCKGLVNRNRVQTILINIDSYTEEFDRIPYSKYIRFYVDEIYKKTLDIKRGFNVKRIY